MGRRFASLLIFLLIFNASISGNQKKKGPSKPSPCWDSPNQGDLNDCAGKEYESADAELNRVYQKLIETHKGDAIFVEHLKAAQRAWVAYRDAHLNSWYPEVDKRFYGSVRPMCSALILARLTEERVRILKDMLSPKEGDVCAFYSEVER